MEQQEEFILNYAVKRLDEMDPDFVSMIKEKKQSTPAENLARNEYCMRKVLLKKSGIQPLNLMVISHSLDKTVKKEEENKYSIEYLTKAPYLVACLERIVEILEKENKKEPKQTSKQKEIEDDLINEIK